MSDWGELERELAAVRREFCAGLEARRAALQSRFEAVKSGAAERELLIREVHTLAGAALTLGLAEIGQAAQSLEQSLRKQGEPELWRAGFAALDRALGRAISGQDEA